MRTIKIIFILFFLNSCSFINGIRVELKNETSFPITNVKFYTSEKLAYLNFVSVNVHENVTGFLSMARNQFDGSYVLEYTLSNGQVKHFSNGYYTNGGSLDEKVIITIKNDTTIMNFVSKEY